jgi:hypothetical protein
VDSGAEQDLAEPDALRRIPGEQLGTASAPNPQSNSEDEHREPNPLIDFTARMTIALAIYVASIGPMYWHWYQAKFLNGWWIVAASYEPLFIVAGWIPPLGRWLNWYICLWIY